MPTYERISKIRKEFNSLCPRCGSNVETLIHALKDCPRAKAVLVHGGLKNSLVEGSYWKCVDWIEDAARSLDKKALSDFITVLWNIWNSRNNKVFNDTKEDAKVTWDRAATLSRDFRIFNIMEKPAIPKPVGEKGWQKPGPEVVKINFDAAVNDRMMSFGVVARDNDGFVLGGVRVLLIETLKLNGVNRLKKAHVDFSTLGHRIRELFLLFEPCFNFNFVWTPRSCNKAADQLYKWAYNNKCNKVFDMDYPLEIHDVILKDAIN
ncbi:hypothetical protein Golob_014601 [Gossypium lobatum]|uniref:RNase H type-1 domain-containing protein n=1 Tax=Gossypium lobatum TaxID=34289 RepID=A0A7J8LYK5_9ROSI|nr:hypothetical protein [Gossypium lobatum]